MSTIDKKVLVEKLKRIETALAQTELIKQQLVGQRQSLEDLLKGEETLPDIKVVDENIVKKLESSGPIPVDSEKKDA